jgi:hypothetical protein
LRCQASKVSGVTKVTASANNLRPNLLACTQTPALIVAKPQSTIAQLLAKKPVFFP